MVIDNVDLSYCSRFEGNERGEAITFTVLTCSVASRKRIYKHDWKSATGTVRAGLRSCTFVS